jgi:K+-transporting ATPase A subunit
MRSILDLLIFVIMTLNNVASFIIRQRKVAAFAQHKSQYPSGTPAGELLVKQMLTNIGGLVAQNAQVQ